MNRLIKITALIFAAAFLASPVLGQMGGGMMGSGTGGGAGSGMMGYDMMGGKAKDMMIRGSEMRNAEGMMGMGFMHRGSSDYGSYVTFSVDNNTGAVMDYGILGNTIFDSIKITDFNFGETLTMGGLTRIVNIDKSKIIQLHDNPAGVINVISKSPVGITFDLADGVNASKEDNIVRIESGNLTAFVAAVNASSIDASGGEIKIISGRSAVFRAVPVNMPAGMMNQRFMGEMMKNKAGAEIAIGTKDKYSIVNYSENMHVAIGSMGRDRMRMMINSTDPSGKFIMMNLDNSSMMWNQTQRLRFYLDNKPMMQVMSEEELYNAKESSFWINVPGSNQMMAMMYIANFSERVVDVVVEEELTPTQTSTLAPAPVSTTTPASPGLEIALGLLSVGIAYQLRRRS